MTPTGTATSWEPMKLHHIGEIEEVMQGGTPGGGTGPANGKSVPAPYDPGEGFFKPHGQE